MLKTNNSQLFPFLLVIYEVIIYLSNDAYLPALPDIARDLSTTHHPVQLTLTTWFLGSASMQLILGPVSDRYGRRPVLLIGVILFIVSTLICSLTNTISILLFFRFIQGSTITSMLVAGYATIHELYDTEKAIHILAWMNSVTVLAPSLGPLLGAFILHFLGWRWIFGVLVVAATAVGLLLFSWMPETNPNGKEKHPIKLKKIKTNYKNILTNKLFMCTTLSFCFLFGAMIAWIAAGPFLLITELGHSSFVFASVQLIVFGSFIVGTRLIKHLMKRFPPTFLIKLGLINALIGGLLALLFGHLFPTNLGLFVIAMIMIASGAGVCFPVLNRTAVDASQEPMGSRIAMFSSIMGGLGMVGSAFVSQTYDGTLASLSEILFGFSTVAFGFGYCGLRMAKAAAR